MNHFSFVLLIPFLSLTFAARRLDLESCRPPCSNSQVCVELGEGAKRRAVCSSPYSIGASKLAGRTYEESRKRFASVKPDYLAKLPGGDQSTATESHIPSTDSTTPAGKQQGKRKGQTTPAPTT